MIAKSGFPDRTGVEQARLVKREQQRLLIFQIKIEAGLLLFYSNLFRNDQHL